MILRKIVRQSKPDYPVEIDWSNPITRGINVCIVPDAHSHKTPRDISQNRRSLSIGGSFTNTIGKHGRAIQTNGDGANYISVGGPIPSGPVSVLCIAKRDVATATTGDERVQMVARTRLASEAGYWAFNLGNNFTANPQRAYWVAGGSEQLVIDGKKQASFFSDFDLVNGRYYNFAMAAPSAGLGTGYSLFGRPDTDFSVNGSVALYVQWNRQLSNAELVSITANPWQILLPQRIWGLSTALSAVQSDTTLPWSILNALTQDSGLAWDIQQGVSSDQALSWSLIQAISNDSILSWDSIESVLTDKALTWSIVHAIESDQELRWSLVNAIQNDSIVAWDLLQAIDNDASLKWSLISSIFSDSTIQWNLSQSAGTVFSDLQIQWSLLATIYQSLSANWDTVNAVVSNNELRWSLLETISNDLAGRWDVIEALQQDSALQWSVLVSASGDLDFRWSIEGKVSTPTLAGRIYLITGENRVYSVSED